MFTKTGMAGLWRFGQGLAVLTCAAPVASAQLAPLEFETVEVSTHSGFHDGSGRTTYLAFETRITVPGATLQWLQFAGQQHGLGSSLTRPLDLAAPVGDVIIR